jgi:hypothetical protein
MHQKLTKHGRFCKKNIQLPTKSHDELENNFYWGELIPSKLGSVASWVGGVGNQPQAAHSCKGNRLELGW